LNFLSNALKFTDTGEVRVEAAYDGAYLELQVIDSGIGMSKETMAHLFAPFSQADSSMTRRFGGTGLGLAISRQLAARMGGEISAKSEPGFGSTFTVRLPLTRVSDSAAVRGEDSPQPAGASAVVSRPIRILVAEDNPTNQLVLNEQQPNHQRSRPS
jgi:two-component system sensor histidine kinase EvgS